MSDYYIGPVLEARESERFAFVIGAAETSKTHTIRGNGNIHTIAFTVPDTTNNVAMTLAITNSDGVELYNSTAKAENAHYDLSGVDTQLSGKLTMTVSCLAPGGSGGTAYVKLYLKP